MSTYRHESQPYELYVVADFEKPATSQVDRRYRYGAVLLVRNTIDGSTCSLQVEYAPPGELEHQVREQVSYTWAGVECMRRECDENPITMLDMLQVEISRAMLPVRQEHDPVIRAALVKAPAGWGKVEGGPRLAGAGG